MAANGQNNNQGGGWSWNRILFIIAIWYFVFGNRKPAETNPSTGQPYPPHQNVYPSGLTMDLWVYRSEDKEDVSFKPEFLLWHEKGLVYGSWDSSNTRKSSTSIELSETVQHNGTLFAHIFFVRPSTSPDPDSDNFKDPLMTKVHPLTKYLKKVTRAKHNLMTGEMDSEWVRRKKELEDAGTNISTSIDKIEILSHWKGNLTINIVTDFTAYPRGGIPEQMKKHMNFDKNGNYFPVIFPNEFWSLNEQFTIINDTVKSVNLDMEFQPLSLMMWNLYSQMEESFSMQKDLLGAEEGESEEFKRVLLDNNPYILGLTFAISLAHTVLDVMAFKEDIQFWHQKKSMEGMSIQTLYVNVVCNIIIFLYLLDNDTSWMVLFSVGAGLVIEIWKLTRAVQVTIGYWRGIPYPVFIDKQSYLSGTKQHDLAAMKYLYWALYPCVIGYAGYSLMYESHKSWYSFIISTLAGCVYTFGFIMMTPQLFINYKLKSVAHLPLRVFIYKAISTFIDDLFAFLIRMPTMHRLRVFRDDLVFLIYLYQRWVYPVDKKRVEVGASFEDVSLAEIEAAKAEMQTKEQKEKEAGKKEDKSIVNRSEKIVEDKEEDKAEKKEELAEEQSSSGEIHNELRQRKTHTVHAEKREESQIQKPKKRKAD